MWGIKRKSKKNPSAVATPRIAAFAHPAFVTLAQMSADRAVVRHKASGTVLALRPLSTLDADLRKAAGVGPAIVAVGGLRSGMYAAACKSDGTLSARPLLMLPGADMTAMASGIDALLAGLTAQTSAAPVAA